MSNKDLRNKLLEYINLADDHLLFAVNDVIESYKIDNAVARDVNGNPISRQEYIERNEKAVASYKKGSFKTQSQIREKYKSN